MYFIWGFGVYDSNISLNITFLLNKVLQWCFFILAPTNKLSAKTLVSCMGHFIESLILLKMILCSYLPPPFKYFLLGYILTNDFFLHPHIFQGFLSNQKLKFLFIACFLVFFSFFLLFGYVCYYKIDACFLIDQLKVPLCFKKGKNTMRSSYLKIFVFRTKYANIYRMCTCIHCINLCIVGVKCKYFEIKGSHSSSPQEKRVI